MADAYAAAKAWFIRGDDVKAQELCEKALKLADELRPIPREMGNALHLLGAIHLRRQSPDLALTCFERAVVIKKFFEGSEEPSESQISTWLALGSAQLQAGRPADAAGCLQQVVDAMEERDEEKPVLANAYHSLGAAYRAGTLRANARREHSQGEAERYSILIGGFMDMLPLNPEQVIFMIHRFCKSGALKPLNFLLLYPL
ncbi:unnamed protein product [Durusdinium trenchii]|uniref:Uncharacterized protein n=1 Tax=Durusdinium trenchii TaxID=1381693 RepID=A0ABP0JGQ0_9DINO